MNHRRALLVALGGALALPRFAIAQQAEKVYRIGFVGSVSSSDLIEAFRQGLKEAGYIEGKNVIVEMRFWEGRAERAPELVAEVLRLKVDVLVAMSAQTALAAQKATTTVPIVFASVVDPVGLRIVASLARPGGNITGATLGVGGSGFGGKWLELLKEAAPGVSRVAVLWNSANPASRPYLRELQAAALTLNTTLDVHGAGDITKFDKALAAIGASGAQAIILVPDPFLTVNRAQILQFAASKRLPAMYPFKNYADAGGLMSYGDNPGDSARRSVKYVDRILKGAKPADLPVEQPTTFKLVINLKTAKALGLTIKPALLLRADEVIQ
jgi:putative ABC transport system substrate-binding protein